MRLLVYILQFVNGIVRVDLRRGETGMTQEFLYGVDISTIIHEVCRESMAEDMRAFFVYRCDEVEVFLYDLIDIGWIEEFSLLIDKEINGWRGNALVL